MQKCYFIQKSIDDDNTACYSGYGRSSDTAHESLCVTDQVKKFSLQVI